MTVGIVGLGLIGGSMAKAYHADGQHKVLAWNRSRSMLDFAIMSGAVDGELNEETIKQCDLLILVLYPQATIAYLEKMAPHIAKETIVIDGCGTKQQVCEAGFRLAKQYGFTFVGGHPMAGTHNSGFKYSTETMFVGAPMVLVPPTFDNIELLMQLKKMLAPLKFGSFSVTTAEKHDEMIAFTSQMPHLVSNAFIKSPTAASHKGFSAGSYRDLTRVAWLNPTMWADLFIENRECLLNELDSLIGSLQEYRVALENKDMAALEQLLDDGRRRKEEVDGKR